MKLIALRLLFALADIIDNDILWNFLSKYDNAWRYLKTWLNLVENRRVNPTSHMKILVVAMHPQWEDFMLVLSLLFLSKGADVTFVRPNPKRKSGLNDASGKLRVEEFLKNKDASSTNFRVVIPTQENSSWIGLQSRFDKQLRKIDVPYTFRINESDVDWDSQGVLHFCQEKRQDYYELLKKVESLENEIDFNLVVMPSGAVLEYRVIFDFFKERGKKITTIETWSGEEVCFSRPSFQSILQIKDEMDEIWKSRKYGVTEPSDVLLKNLMTLRANFRTKELMLTKFDDKDKQLASLSSWIGEQSYALLLTNVPFDGNFYIHNEKRLFEDFEDWALNLLRFIAREKIKTVVKIHPAEKIWLSGLNGSFYRILEKVFKHLPDHIFVVAPDSQIDIVELFEGASVGLVYASTTVLELSINGIPVCCGLPGQYYSDKGFVTDVNNKEEYFNSIIECVTHPRKLTEDQIRSALVFSTLYFTEFPKLLPIGNPHTVIENCRGNKLSFYLNGKTYWDLSFHLDHMMGLPRI
jgi:hypothetical protein